MNLIFAPLFIVTKEFLLEDIFLFLSAFIIKIFKFVKEIFS